ncbi:MAG: FAD-dependent oxidoreductase [Ruminococcaceae bacterium]|nr:FAD-dependent oxidoreductase [Oscillospiraceae bacterium]
MLAIIGAGPAGLAAALEAHKEGIKDIVIFERAKEPGGILLQCIHTGFGLHYFNEEISGPEYAARFSEAIKDTDIKLICDTMVTSISKDLEIIAMNKKDGLMKFKADAIILAMGCRERPRGALNIYGTRPSGIMTAGAAQEYINIKGYMPGKKCVILGSGDIGLIMARRMTLEGAKVEAVCELLPFSGGLKRNIVQCLDDYGIPLRLSTTVVCVHGKERLEGVTIAKVDDKLQPIPDTEEYIECDTLLLSVGLIPENELSQLAGIKIDPVTKGPVVSDTRETSISGIFACGNVLQVHDLVDFVTLESQVAGKAAAEFIKNRNLKNEFAKVVPGERVRYIVPQKVSLPVTEELTFYFRVTNEFDNMIVSLSVNDKEIYSKKKRKLAPGEMENLKIKTELFENLTSDDVIEIKVKEK